ncbi:hypothetical protein VI817_009972 [Penicillium citrinum]|nr:hypothetical protein VI817_009972 [Penicillium citrinum]
MISWNTHHRRPTVQTKNGEVQGMAGSAVARDGTHDWLALCEKLKRRYQNLCKEKQVGIYLYLSESPKLDRRLNR